MSNKTFRQVIRIGHIIEGILIALFIYSPTLAANSTYIALMQFVVFPAIAISGLLLWQQPRVLKFVRQMTNQNSNA
ncbi:MAG: hypothetical protein AAFN11_13565 [Chloroflexota bacterium]